MKPGPTRREALGLLAALVRSRLRAAAPAACPQLRFRLAICNDPFQGWAFGDAVRAAKNAGYAGLEIAPYTLAAEPTSIPPSRRAQLRRAMRSEGIAFVGLHNLLAAPKGLHVTTPDASVRRRSWQHVRALVDLGADLGEGGILVFGSGKQRAAVAGSSVRAAAARLQDGLAAVAPAAAARGVTILIEPLAPQFSNVINTLAEAVALVEHIGSPAVRAMFDTHNTAAEKLPAGELLRKYYHYIYHVHLNEMGGRYPASGGYDFAPVLQALRDLCYRRWLSVEAFDFTAGAEKIAASSAQYLRRVEVGLR